MYKTKKARQQSHWRFFGGVALASLFVAALVLRVAGLVKLDEVTLALLACVVGSILFALSYQLGITKIAAGPLKVEIQPLIEQAVEELPSDQAGEVWRVLERHSDLFPVVGVRLLWVDDKPERLIPQRRLLRRLGMNVVAVKSTDAARTEIMQDSDFALIIQDHLRHVDGKWDAADARALIEWLDQKGSDYGVKETPLIVFSFDSFAPSLGVKEWNWITKDFASLLNRVAKEVKRWKQDYSPDMTKGPY